MTDTAKSIQFLRLYVDPAWRRAGIHSPLMNPFWGNPHTEESLFAKEFFDRYNFDTSLYTITDDIKNADMVFPPYRQQWLMRHDQALMDACAHIATQTGLPLLIDGVSDVEPPVNFPNAYVLRIGGYRFLPEQNSIQIPTVVDDLLVRCVGGKLELREKSDIPTIGFAGWARLPLKQTLRSMAKEFPIRIRGIFDGRYRAMQKGIFWRQRAINALQKSNLVACNFLLRDTFSGSTKTAGKSLPVLRQEMVDNLLQSDYGLDVRGDPNASNRLYEILSMGRIPVVVDTERRFPFSDEVDYDSFALRVDFRDIRNLPERIAEFHRSLSPERFQEMQKNAREAFLNHFRIEAIMPHLLRELYRLGVRSR